MIMYEVSRTILLHDLVGAMELHCSKDISSQGALHRALLLCPSPFW